MQSDRIIAAIKSALPLHEQYNLHEPFFGEEEKQAVVDCIDSGWVSYHGDYVKKFEEELAKLCEVKHAITLSSGTVSLFMALKALGIKEGDEVILPSLTFVATANAVSHCGATPHFVDISRKNLAIDPEKLDEYLSAIDTSNIKAIVPVHVFGHAADMDKLNKVAKKHGLIVIEDAAEALGAKYNGKALGSLSTASVLSFNGNKIITTGGGGAILTNDDALADKIRHLSTTAKLPHAYEFIHDEVGYNFRLSNLNAALGYAQLKKLDKFLTMKENLKSAYKNALSEIDWIEFFEAPGYSQGNNWLNAFVVDDASQKNSLIEAIHESKIFVRPLWKPMHMLEIYKESPKSELSATEDIYNRLICLPSSVFLGNE